MKAIFMGTQGCAGNTLYPVRAWRFNCQFAATQLQALNHRLNLAASFPCDVITQPDSQHVGIGDRGLAEAEADADFSTQSLRCAPSEKGFAVYRRRHIELLAQRGDALRFDFGLVTRKPAKGRFG